MSSVQIPAEEEDVKCVAAASLWFGVFGGGVSGGRRFPRTPRHDISTDSLSRSSLFSVVSLFTPGPFCLEDTIIYMYCIILLPGLVVECFPLYSAQFICVLFRVFLACFLLYLVSMRPKKRIYSSSNEISLSNFNLTPWPSGCDHLIS